MLEQVAEFLADITLFIFAIWLLAIFAAGVCTIISLLMSWLLVFNLSVVVRAVISWAIFIFPLWLFLKAL